MLQRVNSPIPIVLVAWTEDFVFNDALLNVKDFILCCFAEYGWNFPIVDSHIWGENKIEHRYIGAEWEKFDNWIKSNPPRLIFKRELLKKDVTDKILPIEYPCLIPRWEV